MAQYDAGSIEATLDVNTDPFDEGLARAQERARRFSADDHTSDLGVRMDDGQAEAEMRRIHERLRQLAADDPNIDVRFRDDEAKAEIEALRLRLRELHDKTVTVRVNTRESQSQLGELEQAADRASGGGSSGGGGHFGVGGLIAKIGLLGTLGGGVINPLVGEVLGAGGAFAIAGAGAGAFGLMAGQAMKTLSADTKAVTKAQDELTNATTDAQRIKAMHDLAQANAQLKGPIAQAAIAQAGMNKEWAQFKQQTNPAVFGALGVGMNQLTAIMPHLTGFVNSSANAFGGMFKQIGAGMQSPAFDHFMGFLSRQIGPILHSVGGDIVNLGKGFAQMLEAAMPVVNVFMGQLHQLTAGFSHLTGSPAFSAFMRQLAGDMKMLTPVVKEIFTVLGHLLQDLQPLVRPVLSFLNSFLHAVDVLIGPLSKFMAAIAGVFAQLGKSGVLTQIATLFGHLLTALAPLLPVIGQLAVALLPPLIQALDDLMPVIRIAVTVISAIAKGFAWLLKELGPVLPVILLVVGALAAAGPVIGAVAAAFAILLDPITLVIAAIVGIALAVKEIVTHWTAIAHFFERIWHDVVGFVTRMYHDVVTFVQRMWHDVTTFFARIWHDIAGFAERIWHDVTGFFARIWHDVVNFVSRMVKDVVGFWLRMNEDVIKFVVRMVTDVINFFARLWNDVTGFVSRIFHDVTGFFSNLWHTVTGFVSRLWHDVTSFVARIWHDVVSAISNMVSSVVGFVAHLVSNVASGFAHMASAIGSAIATAAQKVWSFFSGLPGKVWDAIKTTIGTLADVGKAIIEGIYNGIKDVAGWLWDHISKFFSDIWDRVKGWFGVGSPSKKAADEVGMPIAWGIAKGLTDNKHLIHNAIKDLGNMEPPDIGYRLSGQHMIAVTEALHQTAAVTKLNTSIESLRDDVRALPKATGTEVGNKVGDKFDKTMQASETRVLTATRRNGG